MQLITIKLATNQYYRYDIQNFVLIRLECFKPERFKFSSYLKFVWNKILFQLIMPWFNL